MGPAGAANSVPPPPADVQEMHYSYGEMVSLLTADFVRCRREERQLGGISDDQVLHHVRHWDGFNAMVNAVAAGRVRLGVSRTVQAGSSGPQEPKT
ncbi:hypothetical protein [Nocardia abscessus]|uniref:hypothetical protein n=1 Tax=Nocardia abscessus TaxID=120957 RepID=UPI002457F3B6|nr:hypothetical protein [Nocardia abscessus]